MMSRTTLRLPALRRSRLGAALAASVLCFAGAALEPVAAEDFPEPPAEPPAKEADAGWSTPSGAAPTPASSTLPPPRIVRRTSARTTTPSVATPPAPTAPAAPVPPPPATPSAGTFRETEPRAPMQATPLPPRDAPPASAVQQARAPACRILSIQKTHNVEQDTVARGGALYLQLDIDYEVRGQQGRDVYVAVWFARTADGSLVKSLTHDYSDGAGHVTVQTRWTRVIAPSVRYAARVLVPYHTFPADPSQASYEIDARVQILRKEAARGRVSILARDKTTFRVYGAPADERRDPPSGPALDRRPLASPGLGEIDETGIPEGFGAEDVAGETGTIRTPGIQDGSGAKATPGEAGRIIDLPSPVGK